MKVGYIQNDPVFGKKADNLAQVSRMAGGIRADLLVLPELFATGYAFTSREEALSLAETDHGATAAFLKQLSDDTGAVVVAGFAEKDQDRVYNSAMMVFGHEVIAVYRKIHLFNREKLWFDAGDKPLDVHTVNGMKIGMMICFDWMFPEAMRTLALRGAQVVAHPSNLVMPWCQQAMVTRCVENRIFAVTANRIGRETRGDDDFLFTGRSQVTCVNGNVLAGGPISATDIQTVDIDIDNASNKQLNPHNHLFDDRRPEFYL